MSEVPRFVDVANPTADELRGWAGDGALEPMEDWDVVIAEPANAGVLVELVAAPRCAARSYLLGSLYCLVSHCDRDDPG